MKTILMILIILTGITIQAQVDTLMVGNRKFPLKLVETKFAQTSGDIFLPTEYENTDRILEIPYERRDSYDFMEFDTEAGEVIWCKKKNEIDTLSGNVILCRSFLDTITVNIKDLADLHLYIKTKDNGLSFFSTTIYTIKNGKKAKYLFLSLISSRFFYKWSQIYQDDMTDETELKSTLFIVDGLYYRKGLTTYFLDRQFVVMVK